MRDKRLLRLNKSLIELLKPFLSNSSTPNVLELFARTLSAGFESNDGSPHGKWCSVGNEAIKFNEISQWWITEST